MVAGHAHALTGVGRADHKLVPNDGYGALACRSAWITWLNTLRDDVAITGPPSWPERQILLATDNPPDKPAQPEPLLGQGQ